MSGKIFNEKFSLFIVIIFLWLPFENDWWLLVIDLKPIFFNKFSMGKNSPKGTNLTLLYESNKFNS